MNLEQTLNTTSNTAAGSTHSPTHGQTGNPSDLIEASIRSIIEPMGFESVALEIVNNRQKILRLFIDRMPVSGASLAPATGITVEDCAIVSRAIDEPLDALPAVDSLFKGTPYELEVSSPGVERPLRQPKDFIRFAGRETRIHLFRPLSAEESGNPGYQSKNPKQKNFFGKLIGFESGSVLLAVSLEGGPSAQKKVRKKGAATPTKTGGAEAPVVSIPLILISKAHLSAEFDFEAKAAEIEAQPMEALL
jgi:ribosome maturation factor RimP